LGGFLQIFALFWGATASSLLLMLSLPSVNVGTVEHVKRIPWIIRAKLHDHVSWIQTPTDLSRVQQLIQFIEIALNPIFVKLSSGDHQEYEAKAGKRGVFGVLPAPGVETYYERSC